MSERRACELLDVDRSSYRYRPRPDRNVELRQRLMESARERPRFGYRRLWLLLNHEGGPINRKRVHAMVIWALNDKSDLPDRFQQSLGLRTALVILCAFSIYASLASAIAWSAEQNMGALPNTSL